MNRKGFTTIELIIAITIAGIIMGAVGTFMTFNLRSFNATTDIIDIQYEGQLAMTQLVDIIRESKGVESITGYTTTDATDEDKINASYEVIPTSVVFHHTEWDASASPAVDQVTSYTLTFDAVNNKILCTVGGTTTASYDLARHITSFTLTPAGNEYIPTTDYEDFQFSDTFLIRLTLEEGKASQQLETQVKIRNKIN